MRSALLLLLGLAACDDPFNPSGVGGPHTNFNPIDNEGFDHPPGYEQPFRCRAGDDGRNAVACETLSVQLGSDFAPENYSCDSAGCHGRREPGTARPSEDFLHGGEGPSCFTCHDDEWND